MNRRWPLAVAALTIMTRVGAAELKVDLRKEEVGKAPKTFEPIVGTWVVAQDGPTK